MVVDTDEDEWLPALSEDEDEPTPAPPAKRPRWPREPSFDSESEGLRAKRTAERKGAFKTQSTRLQVAEKPKQPADMRKTAQARATVAETSTAAKMEQRAGELERDEWTMWVDGVM